MNDQTVEYWPCGRKPAFAVMRAETGVTGTGGDGGGGGGGGGGQSKKLLMLVTDTV